MKHFKLFFACALMSLFSLGQVWAVDPVTVPLSISDYATANSWVSETVYSSVTIDANVTASVSSGSNTGKYYSSNQSWRVYESESGTITISTTSGTLSSVTFTYGKNNNGVILDGTTQVATGSAYDISGTSKTFSVGHSSGTKNGNVQIQSISVTYTPAGGSTPTLTGVTVSGNPTKKEYSAGDNFDPAGLTVTGTYSDASTAPITSGITWTYNPAQTLVKDQTSIGVIATVSSIASAEYNVTGLTVTAAPTKITITQDEVASFTNTYAEYTWTAGGVSGKMYAYKNAGMQFNSSKTGYYVYNTDPIPGRITKITMTKASGTDRSWTPYVSTTAMTAPVAEKALDAQTVTSTGVSWDVTGSNSYFYLTVAGGSTVIGSIVIEYTEDAPPAIDAPSISGDVNFVGSTTVTISHDDADHIYYTTNGVDPTTSSTEYTAPFVVNADGTTTVKAIAVKGSDVSEVASKGFTKVEALESMAALLEATTSTETAFNVVISNWVVTGVSGTRAWIADAANEKGILLYKSGHNFVAGNKLNGVVIGTKSKLYQGYPELTSLVSTDVTVTTAETVTPRTTTIAALTSGHPAEQGTIVKLEDLTYTASSTSFSDGANTIQIDTKLYSPALVDGATYTITGVVEYLASNVIKLMPRSEDDVEQTSAASLPEVTGLAALKAETTGSSYLVNLTDAVVTLVDGNNAFIEDATAGALIYFSGHGYAAGDKLNGQYEVTTATYQGKFEITAMEAQTGATKVAEAEIPVTTMTIAQLAANFAANESKRIKIVGVNVTDAIGTSDRNGQISDGANTFALYAGKNGVTAAENANIDVIGYPTFYNEDHQFNVWAQADITVNEKDPAGIAFTPESETITGGDPWSAPAFANPNSLTVTFSGDNDAVATVNTTTGEITLEGGYGTAVITAHTDGDATHASATVTYTITVNDPAATPVYTMSFDMTRASYDDAADAQVVWNSNVVTMTADKNDGTKVTNYLAGNYSGTTHIAETRLYAKNSISFVPQSGVTITKIEWMSTAKGYATKLAAETFVNATAVVDGTDDKLVIITPSAAGEISVTLTDAARATRVTVYYEAASEKAKLAASIAIADINMAVGDDDILLSAIAATSNPNKKAISYEVTSGTAVTIEGTGAEAALHAAAEGSATITATIPDDLGNYTGATTSFMVTVSAAATLESIAISGTATELEYTEGQSFNPTGLTVMGHYSNGSDEEITSGIDWTFAPDPLTEGTTSVSVTATVNAITSPAFVVNGLTVSGPAPVGDNYVKVTASQTDWSGDYILVYEDGTDAYVWNGDYSDGASNYASATITSNTIAKPAAAAVITIAAASEGKYTLQVNGDKYFQDNGSNSKLIFTDAIADAAEVTISYETDWTQLLFSERCIRFNSSSGQTRFRFYAASSQQAVQLYKKDVPTPPTPTTVRSGLTAGNYYTICYPKAMTNITGATLWSFVGKDADWAYIEQETATTIEAGKPYILYATAETVTAELSGDDAPSAGSNGALHGTFALMEQAALDAAGTDVYLVIENKLRLVSNQSLNRLPANRAYVKLSEITGGKPNPAPGKNVRSMPMHKDTATGIDDLNATDAPRKVMIEGTLYILRGEKMFDATGRLVK